MSYATVTFPQSTFGNLAPVELNVNDTCLSIPRGIATPVTEDQFLVLLSSGYAPEMLTEIHSVGDTAAEAASAPVDSGGDSDAGGGGETGSAATDTSIPPLEEPDVPETFLDRSIAAILPDLEGRDTDFLEAVRKLEQGGKTRTTLIAKIDELLTVCSHVDRP